MCTEILGEDGSIQEEVMKMEMFCMILGKMNCSFSHSEMRKERKTWRLKDTDTLELTTIAV